MTAGGIDLDLNGDARPDASTVSALFGDIRAWKGRPGYSASAKENVRKTLDQAKTGTQLTVHFSHPPTAAYLTMTEPHLIASCAEDEMPPATPPRQTAGVGHAIALGIVQAGALRQPQRDPARPNHALHRLPQTQIGPQRQQSNQFRATKPCAGLRHRSRLTPVHTRRA